MATSPFFFVSFVYAFNDHVERRTLWKDLTSFSKSIHNHLWMVIKDFNVKRKPKEKLGGIFHDNLSKEFNDMCNDSGLDNLWYSGSLFTWYNKNNGDRRILCKLDKALINDSWLRNFASSNAIF